MQGTIWWIAEDKAEAEQWKADLEGKGATVAIRPLDETTPKVSLYITLDRNRAEEVLGYQPDEEEWLTPDEG